MKMRLLPDFCPFCPFVLNVTQMSNYKERKPFFLLLFIICCLWDSVTERTKVIADGSNGVNQRQKMTIRAAENAVLYI